MKQVHTTLFVFAVVVLNVTAMDQAGAMSLFGGHSSPSAPTQTLRQSPSQNNTNGSHANVNGLLSINANPITVTPEPSTVVLLGSGLLGFALWRYRVKS
jgi:PEP-CTERM motif